MRARYKALYDATFIGSSPIRGRDKRRLSGFLYPDVPRHSEECLRLYASQIWSILFSEPRSGSFTDAPPAPLKQKPFNAASQ